MKAIYFDTETTGLNCHSCQIIELAMLTVEDGEIVEEYDKFVKVDGFLPSRIVQITGITDQILAKEGVDERDIADDLKERLSEGTVMIAHNCQFDFSFVHALLERHYPLEADDIVSRVDWIDTVTVLKDRKDYPHKLIDAVEYYEIEKVNFHRAIDDTKALYNVVQKMKYERDDLKEYKNIFGYNPKYGKPKLKLDIIIFKPQPYHNRGKLPQKEILPRK